MGKEMPVSDVAGNDCRSRIVFRRRDETSRSPEKMMTHEAFKQFIQGLVNKAEEILRQFRGLSPITFGAHADRGGYMAAEEFSSAAEGCRLRAGWIRRGGWETDLARLRHAVEYHRTCDVWALRSAKEDLEQASAAAATFRSLAAVELEAQAKELEGKAVELEDKAAEARNTERGAARIPDIVVRPWTDRDHYIAAKWRGRGTLASEGACVCVHVHTIKIVQRP